MLGGRIRNHSGLFPTVSADSDNFRLQNQVARQKLCGSIQTDPKTPQTTSKNSEKNKQNISFGWWSYAVDQVFEGVDGNHPDDSHDLPLDRWGPEVGEVVAGDTCLIISFSSCSPCLRHAIS